MPRLALTALSFLLVALSAVVVPASHAGNNATPPAISGTAQAGQTLTVSAGVWHPTPKSFGYAWYRCASGGVNCQQSPTSTNSASYALTSGDVGYAIVATVAPNGDFTSAVSSAPTAVVVAAPAPPPPPPSTPVNTALPTLSGTTQVGQTLTTTNGSWLPSPSYFLYSWYRCTTTGCTGSPTSTSAPNYLLTSGDLGYRIVAQVVPNGDWATSVDTAQSAVITNPVSPPPTSNPVNISLPVLSGTAQAGQTLSTTNGTWNPVPTSYIYSWYRCTATSCAGSPTSTSSPTYLLTSGDVGYQIVAQVVANGDWAGSVDTARSAIVAAAPGGTAPPATGTVPGTALYRLGGTFGSGTNYNKYAYVIVGRSDATAAAQLPGKALVYMSGVDISTGFSTGVDYATALANGWLLKDSSGNYMSGYGSYLGDVGSVAYQQAWASNVASFLASTGADGVYIDDVLSDIATWSTCACFPAKYPSQSAWQSAMASFMASIGPALKAKGYYVLASAHAFIPGNLASNDASLETQWWRQLAPSVSGLSTEYWTENQANYTQLRSVGAQWYQLWDNWQSLVSVAQGAGIDFFGLTYDTAATTQTMRYARASFLIDWNGRGGAVAMSPTDGSDPWNTAWTADVGQPSAAKTQITPNVWLRTFTGGTVVVNANLNAVTVTVAGVSRTIGATDALILTP
jgi:hypothetical protein